MFGGGTVAIKGIGGFHLACDATNDTAVLALRERKGREGKPFAIMVADLDTARRIVRLTEAEARVLTSPRRPIVLAEALTGAGVSRAVAPGNPTGRHASVVAPPPAPHRARRRVAVMTSGNLGSEPIVTDNDEARRLLAPLAEALLLHDRGIHIPCDDSVVRLVDSLELPIRRSRGYAPLPVRLGFDAPPTLGVGGELKSDLLPRGRSRRVHEPAHRRHGESRDPRGL